MQNYLDVCLKINTEKRITKYLLQFIVSNSEFVYQVYVTDIKIY